MKQIFKYKLAIVDVQQLELPEQSEFLTVQNQNGQLCVWAIVDPDRRNTIETILIRGTGHHLQDSFLQYLGTVQMTHLVWHVFRTIK